MVGPKLASTITPGGPGSQGQVSIDTTRCIACGDCLFVCPVDAITGIKPVKRFVQGDTLV
ncbi:4Fe-4S binding protein, partial [Salmonella enterica subsp. enterica serovar Kentucky]|nr:4Fe-4S binding protein [Salmonella enterica subsp. enterica serovar Kentucky]